MKEYKYIKVGWSIKRAVNIFIIVSGVIFAVTYTTVCWQSMTLNSWFFHFLIPFHQSFSASLSVHPLYSGTS